MSARHVLILLISVVTGCGQSEPDPLSVLRQRAAASNQESDSPPKYTRSWHGSETVTVARGVHVFGRLFPSAAFAIETSQGLILIDSGVDENGLVVRESLLEIGFQPKQIRYILLTHAHYDHVFGVNQLRTVSGATVCAGREDCATLRSPDLAAMFSVFPQVSYSGDPIEVDRELDDGEIIELGDTRIEVIGAPGHTPGSVCYLLQRDQETILFSGDVIASLNYGPATYPVHLAPRYRGDASSYLQTIRRLMEMPCPDLLLTGHPNQHRRMRSIELDEPQWQSLLQLAEQELQQAVTRQQQDGADFLDETAKSIEPGLWYLGICAGIGVYCLEHEDQRILINAPGGPMLADFLGKAFRLLGLDDREPTTVWLTSTAESNWSGLNSLSTKPQIVVLPAVADSLRSAGFDNLIAPEQAAETSGHPLQILQLTDSLAYSISIGDKQVLLTPDVPRNLSLTWKDRQTGNVIAGALQPQTDQWKKALSADEGLAATYRADLETLRQSSPQVWLPAIPLSGQNANLYDDQWSWMIQNNLQQIP